MTSNDYAGLFSLLKHTSKGQERSSDVAVEPSSGPVRCAYCKGGENEGFYACEGCGTKVHLACLIDYGDCPTFGCDAIGKGLQPPAVKLSPEEIADERIVRKFQEIDDLGAMGLAYKWSLGEESARFRYEARVFVAAIAIMTATALVVFRLLFLD